MEEGYRIPKIEEFVEGFKYEIPHTTRMDIVDFSNPENTVEGKWTTTWFKRVVPNLDPIEYPYTVKEKDGTTWTFMNDSGGYHESLDQIKNMLEQGLIRTKV